MPQFSENIIANVVEVSFLNLFGMCCLSECRYAYHTFIQMLIIRNKDACILSNGIGSHWRHREESLIFGGSYTFRKTCSSR